MFSFNKLSINEAGIASLPIPLAGTSFTTINFPYSEIPIKLAGVALCCTVSEKLAQIIKPKFPFAGTLMSCASMGIGLIGGAFAGKKTIAISTVALLILAPAQAVLERQKECQKELKLLMENLVAPSNELAFIKDMKENRENLHYIPLTEKINLIGDILNKCEKRNVLIIGNPGSGKTSVVEAIVQMQLDGNCSLHPGLVDKKFYRVSCADMMSDTSLRGDLETKVKHMLEFAASDKNIVLVCDEIHQFALANKSVERGGISILESLKEELARGKISIIGMTTTREFEEFIKPDSALKRRFTEIHLEDPTAEQSLHMLKERGKVFQDKYPDIKCPDGVYDYILDLVVRFGDQTTSLIDQGFDLLDTAYSRVSFSYTSKKVITKEIVDEINKNKGIAQANSVDLSHMYS